MKALGVGIAAAFALTTLATAGALVEADYGWEDGGTILGSYGNLGSAENEYWDADRGNVLALTEDPTGGTPQAYVAWVTGLADGDVIDASFLGLGDGVDTSKVRIWGHYTNVGGDITSYGGSAGGNSAYSGAEWTELGHSWTFDSNGGQRDGLVVEARLYTYSGQTGTTGYVDNLHVSVFGAAIEGVVINVPGPVPAPAALALLGLAGLAGARRRR